MVRNRNILRSIDLESDRCHLNRKDIPYDKNCEHYYLSMVDLGWLSDYVDTHHCNLDLEKDMCDNSNFKKCIKYLEHDRERILSETGFGD
jgi:azurin